MTESIASRTGPIDRHLWLLLFIFLCTPLFAAQANNFDASLHGTVRDQFGNPIPGVQLLLQKKGFPKGLTFTADAHGSYSVTGLSPGEYALHAIVGANTENGPDTLVIKAHDSKTQDLVLKMDPMTGPLFYDKPSFIVSGVVDTTALGGHGSDTVVRTRESIAKDTAKLSNPNAPTAGASPGLESLLQAGKYQEAKDHIRSLIGAGDKAELRHLLADIDEKTGDSLEAVHEYQRAAEMNPSEPYLFDWGSELLLHHAPEPAEEVFAKGNRLFPQSGRMLIGLGAASFARGSYNQAVERICQASDLNPNDPSPYIFLGKMQAAENVSSSKLLDRLRRFVTTQPQNAQANYFYAVALWKQNRGRNTSDPQIATLLSNTTRLDPNFAPAQLQLGILKSEQGDQSSAITHYSRTIEIDPENQEAHFRLSQAYRKQGQTERAKKELQIYQELSKKSAEQVDRERREIPQFVYTLRSQPTLPTPQ